MIMEPFDAFRFYQSIKLHFENKTYDALKYNYKTSAKHQAFWKRKDKYFFAKVGRKFNTAPELISYYVSYFIEDIKWIGEMLNDEEPYQRWLKRMQSFSYNFEQDCIKLQEEYGSFDELFVIDTHPKVVTAYTSGLISLETVVVINKLTGFMNKASNEITETILWPELSLKILKYDPFVNVNTDKMKKIVLKVFTS